jgi:hypothetical protein
METIHTRKPPRRVSIRCTQCGDFDQINDRSARRKVAEGRPHLCRMCRAVQSITPTEDDINYWQSRFTPEELSEMLSAILA